MKNFSRREFIGNSLAGGALLTATPLKASAREHTIDPLIGYDATGMAELVKTGQISLPELTELVIRRIEVMNPIVNCIATPAFDRVLDSATTISTDTPFAGVPILAKDMIDIAGIRRTDGSRLWATNVPGKSPDYIKALKMSGLNIIGTTVVPEFANGLGSELYGRPRNPWDLDYSCALSSSGAACAVASGILPLVHGTDGGGSNRLPASACNLVGYKPSRGRMYSGERGGGHDVFKTNGPISRTVRDAVAMVRACEDPGNPFGLIGDVSGPSARRLRIAYARSGTQPAGSVVASVLDAQDKVAQLLIDLGHEVVDVEHPVDREEYNQMFRWAFLPKFAPLLKIAMDISGRGPLDTGLLTHWTATSMVEGQRYSAEQNATGLAYFDRLAGAFAATFEEFDVMFSATTPFETLRGDAIRTTDDFLDKSHVLETVLSLTSPVNAIGDCAIGLPLSFSNATGMPVGSMFHAPTGQDGMLFEIAFELEQAVVWGDKWAPVSLAHIPV